MEHTQIAVCDEPDLLGNQAKDLYLPLGMAPQQGSTFAPTTIPPSSPIGIHVGRPVAILPHIDPSLPIGLAAAGLGLTKNTACSAVPYAIPPYSLDLSGAAEQGLYGAYRPEKDAMAPEPSASGERSHRNPNPSLNGSLNLSMGPLQQPQATPASPEQLATLLHHYQYLQLQLIHYQQQQQQEQQQRQAGFPQDPPGGRLGQHASFGNSDGNGNSHSMGGDGERNCSNSTSSNGITSHTGGRRDGARDAAAATAPPPGGLTSLLSNNSAPSARGMQEATAALAAHLNGGSSSAGGVEGGRRQGKSVGEDAEGEAAGASEFNGHHHDHHHHHHHQHQLQQQQQKHGQDPGATLSEQADEAEEEEEEEGTGQRAEGGGGLLGGREGSPNGECTSQTSSEGMREIEELLKRLNPLAKEFVPPPSPLSTPSSVASPHSLSSAQTQVMSPFFPYAPAPLLGPLPPLGQLAAALGQVAAMSQAGQVPASPGAAGMMWPDHHRFNYRQQQQQQQHGRYQQRQQQQHHHGHHHPQQQQQRQPHRGGQGAVLRAGSAPHSDFSQGGRFANGAGAGERAVGKWDRRPGGGEDGRRGARGVVGAPAPAAAGAGEGIGGGNGAAEGSGAAETAAGAGLGFADAAVAATSAASVASKGVPKNGRSKTAEQSVRRTVYVSDLDQQVTEEQLAEIFQACGQVVDCRICGDPTSVLRFAFVEFTEEEAAKKALGLAGTMLGFYPLRVLPSKTAIQPVNPRYLPRSEEERELCARTVYCTNIDRKVTQVDVKLFFETLCGEVSKLRLLGDFQHHTRIAFVEFAQAESATAALNCSGAVLGSLPIRVSPSKTPVRPRAAKPDGSR